MRSSRIRWVSAVAGLAGLGLLLLAAGCPSSPPKPVKVEYQVTGSARTASMTYTNMDGGISQEGPCRLPWKTGFVCYQPSRRFLSISAQNDEDHGDITVYIILDGGIAKRSTSAGAYACADANMMLP
jgi:hypothetical protein